MYLKLELEAYYEATFPRGKRPLKLIIKKLKTTSKESFSAPSRTLHLIKVGGKEVRKKQSPRPRR